MHYNVTHQSGSRRYQNTGEKFSTIISCGMQLNKPRFPSSPSVLYVGEDTQSCNVKRADIGRFDASATSTVVRKFTPRKVNVALVFYLLSFRKILNIFKRV